MKKSINSSPQKVIIFDFDGTIADTIKIFREVYEEIALKKGLPTLDDDTYKRLRKGSIREVLKWVGLKSWQLPGVLGQGRKIFARRASEIMLYDGVPELVKDLKNKNFEIYVLSSNSEKTIKNVLEKYQIDSYIVVLKRPALMGKAMSIKRLAGKRSYKKSIIWMIGDELRDVEAGKKAGVNTISVTWGLQDPETLEAKNPDYLVNSVPELKKILLNN